MGFVDTRKRTDQQEHNTSLFWTGTVTKCVGSIVEETHGAHVHFKGHECHSCLREGDGTLTHGPKKHTPQRRETESYITRIQQDRNDSMPWLRYWNDTKNEEISVELSYPWLHPNRYTDVRQKWLKKIEFFTRTSGLWNSRLVSLGSGDYDQDLIVLIVQLKQAIFTQYKRQTLQTASH